MCRRLRVSSTKSSASQLRRPRDHAGHQRRYCRCDPCWRRLPPALPATQARSSADANPLPDAVCGVSPDVRIDDQPPRRARASRPPLVRRSQQAPRCLGERRRGSGRNRAGSSAAPGPAPTRGPDRRPAGGDRLPSLPRPAFRRIAIPSEAAREVPARSSAPAPVARAVRIAVRARGTQSACWRSSGPSRATSASSSRSTALSRTSSSSPRSSGAARRTGDRPTP